MILQEIILIIFYWVALFFSIILHEISHGLVALWLGDRTAKDSGRLTLDPIKHIDFFGSVILPLILFFSTQGSFVFGWAKPVPYNPYNLKLRKIGPVLVALAGPFTNFLIAFLVSIFGFFLPILQEDKISIVEIFLSHDWNNLLTQIEGKPLNIIFSILAMLIFWNVLLGVFNLIPIPPLDGSKLLLFFLNVNDEIAIFLERYGTFILLFLLFSFKPLSIFIEKIIFLFWEFFYQISVFGNIFFL